jgi:hypothetical protein
MGTKRRPHIGTWCQLPLPMHSSQRWLPALVLGPTWPVYVSAQHLECPIKTVSLGAGGGVEVRDVRPDKSQNFLPQGYESLTLSLFQASQLAACHLFLFWLY